MSQRCGHLTGCGSRRPARTGETPRKRPCVTCGRHPHSGAQPPFGPSGRRPATSARPTPCSARSQRRRRTGFGQLGRAPRTSIGAARAGVRRHLLPSPAVPLFCAALIGFARVRTLRDSATGSSALRQTGVTSA